MNLLLTGGSGLIGWEFLKHAPRHWNIAVAVHRNDDLPLSSPCHRAVRLDITDRNAVEAVVRQIQPEAVVHLGSIGSLDQCKDQPGEARRVNVEGTRNLLEATASCAQVFVFSSTMYVFDGTHPPYDEEAPTNPVNHYACTKLEAERLVLSMARRPVILRPMTVYGWHSPAQRKNWVTWLIGKLEAGEPVKVVNDVFNDYLWVADAGRAIRAALEKGGVSGIFHVGGPEVASRYEFSRRVAEIFDLPTSLITPVGSDYFPSIAQRPGNTTCNIRKLRTILGVEPLGITDGLQSMREAASRQLAARAAAQTSQFGAATGSERSI